MLTTVLTPSAILPTYRRPKTIIYHFVGTAGIGLGVNLNPHLSNESFRLCFFQILLVDHNWKTDRWVYLL